jgi:hypothetical protein
MTSIRSLYSKAVATRLSRLVGQPERPMDNGRLLCNLNDCRAFGIVRLPDCSRRVVRQEKLGNDYRELKTGLGLDHFEGRSFYRLAPPRHPHRAGPGVCTLLRLDPKADAPA